MPPPFQRRLVVLLALVLGAYAINASLTFDGVVDDAWISARYARNLALGHGLVYNVGEPPVEGYTNLAFVLLLAAGTRLGVEMHTMMVDLGVLFGALGLIGVTALTRVLAGGPGTPSNSPWTVAPAALLAVDAHDGVVASNGIESSMFLAAVVGACALVFDGRPWTRRAGGAVGAVLVAVRPEGVAVAGTLAAFDLWTRRQRLHGIDARADLGVPPLPPAMVTHVAGPAIGPAAPAPVR